MASENMKRIKEHLRLMKESNELSTFSPKWLEYNTWIEFRKKTEAQAASVPIEQGVIFHCENYQGIEIEFCIPENLQGDSVIFYIHGGGLIAGNIHTSRPFASLLAVESGLKVCSISYRLAPENPFPAGFDDCFTIYKMLVERYPNNGIALIGESGGGNLCLALTLKAKDEGIKLPSCVVVYSPPTDITGNIKTRSNYASFDYIVQPEFLDIIRLFYCANQDPSNPYISPLYGNYKGFPPLKIVVDSKEVLSEDSRLLAKKAKEEGVEVDFQEWEDTFPFFSTYWERFSRKLSSC